jgi:hypothetical protein
MEGMLEAQRMVVAVARDAPQGLEAGNLGSHVHAGAEVSGMPYFVDRFKERLEPVVEDPVGI